MTDYFARDLASTVLPALKERPVVVITGLRQTGKTPFLQKQAGLHRRRYVTFDDFSQLAAAKSDPDHLANSEQAITIDEVHKCPEILSAIKRAVDKNRTPGHSL